MSWRSQTYLEIVGRLIADIPTLKATGLFNNQFDDLKSGAENMEYPFDFPCIFIAFGGGEWRRQPDDVRICDAYVFRLHIGKSTYNESIEIFDFISQTANALDKWAGATNVGQFKFKREFIDEERTNVIEHILEFEAYVADCSLKDKNAPTTHQAIKEQINAMLEGLPYWETTEDAGLWWSTMDGEQWQTMNQS